MANDTAKPTTAQPVKRQVAAASSTAAAGAPGSKPNAGSKPNSLLGGTLSPLPAERRWTMIAEAAYYLAEKRGFGFGREVEDWLLAEKQIDAQFSA